MELWSPSSFSLCLKTTSPVLISSVIWKNADIIRRQRRRRFKFSVSAISYNEFVQSALEETKRRVVLEPSPLQNLDSLIRNDFQEQYNKMTALDGKTELQMLAFRSSKIRLLRSMTIESETMQVLDFAGFMEPEYDVPIFCANCFSSANMNIVVLDLNPLHQLTDETDYKGKYYKNLMPLYQKYAELLPWGGKLTGESIKFFSPLVIWTKFTSTREKHRALFSAFTEYYKAWLEMTGIVAEEMDPSKVRANREAQHKYLAWRTEKDPGHGVLRRLIGETPSKDLLKNFLFNGVDELGTKTFLDYFPEYRTEEGTVSDQRSIIGKSFDNRPWDSRGEFIG